MKAIVLSILLAGILIGGAFTFSNRPTPDAIAEENNVSLVGGKQIIEIGAKGGYSPQQTIAKADIPTIIRVATKGTFDCSSTLTIPAIDYRKNLPPSGITDIEILPQPAGTTLRGLCAMGMYNFVVKFTL
ncbi:MAG TPA: hypothetical protein VJB69_02260 [Candidatus Paceibacterota bacterium]